MMCAPLSKKQGASFLFGGLLGAVLGVAWVFPGTPLAAFLGWCGAFGLVAVFRTSRRRAISLITAGAVTYAVGAFWFFDVVQRFTETSALTSLGFTFAFLLWHVAPFLFFGVLAGLLPKNLDRYSSRLATAWLILDALWPKLFPWQLGNTQLAFLPFVQGVELFGVSGLTFLMVASSDALFQWYYSWKKIGEDRPLAVLLPALCFCLLLFFGTARISMLQTSHSQIVVGVAQATKRKVTGRERLAVPSVDERLHALTESIVDQVDLVIWPERVLPFRISEAVGHRENGKFLPSFSKQVPLIAGGKTFRSPTELFNSVLLIDRNGSIPPPYHKRRLLPFGEFLPLRDVFERLGLSQFAPKSEFRSGAEPTLLKVRASSGAPSVRIAPFVCFEDTIASLVSVAAQQGVDLLVDLSAGQWAQQPVALYQHETLAAFRAIETRTPLIRVSGNGPSSWIDPQGGVHRIFEVGEEGAAVIKIPLAHDH